MREETLRAANLVLIDYHQRPAADHGVRTGTVSSSDGQRFPTRGKSTTAPCSDQHYRWTL
ncbi:Tn3 family transposase [Nocardia sp. NPDC058176]|uniref:Tn3 family transposase n=1 Tax=Nocardia sp. NPDC058176 TaxID=3346368 RepID=UPI0036D7CC70